MATVIGTVTNIQGMAIVVDTNGNRHMLKIGEALHAGDKVITASGAIVSVKLANGELVNIAEAQTVKITDNLAQVDVSDVTENAVNQAVFDAVLTALNEGRDITEVLEDPAAGAAGSDGNATFVNLDRIQTQGPSSATYDGGNGFVGGPTQGGIPPNFVFLTPASGAPGVSLEGDVNNDGYLNKNELARSGNPGFTNARVTLPAGMEPGDVVNLTHNTGTINRPLTGTDISNGFVTISVPVPAEGDTLVVTATITNQSGQTSPPNSDSAIIDSTPPDANAIKGELPETIKDDTGVSQTDNITSNREPTLIGTTEKVTDKVEVSITYNDPITNNQVTIGPLNATVTAGPNGTGVWTVDLIGANLPDGKYEPTIKVTDLAGNETTKPSEEFTVDGTAPSLNITLDSNIAGDGVVNLIESQSLGIPVTGKVTGEFNSGDTVTITVNGKEFTGTVGADGKFSISVPGADLVADSDKTVDAKITTTDTAGNSTTATTNRTYDVDITPPDLTKISGQLPETIIDDTGSSQTDNLTKNTLPTLIGTTEKVTDKVEVTIDGNKYSATVTAGPNGTAVWSLSLKDINAVPLSSKVYTPLITVTDLAGNVSTKNSETFTVDADAPMVTITLDSDIAGDGVVNIAESNSPAIAVKGTVAGEFRAGDIVTLTINGKEFTGAVAANGSFSINVPGADLAADADRTVEAKITVVDNAGNNATASDTQAYALALTPPALAISLDANVAGDGIVNITESTAAAIPVTGTVSGQFKVGDVVTVTVNGKDFTGTVQAGGKFSINVPGADLAADSDKTIDAKVSTTDIAGNTSTATDTQDYTVNLLPPALAISLDANVAGDGIVNAAESTAASIPVTGTVSGQFKVGDTVTLTINNKTFTGSVLDGGKFSIGVPGADLAADADSTVFASVTTTNAAGNSATATDTQTYTVNTAPPAVAI
ncbi:retention module-containing protein, partial [Methylophilus methylotrophus]|uniref:retention module-containing protein n=1 Tax=Methylophilus methylotrophus TaxID=17 RepID=UPI0012B50A31